MAVMKFRNTFGSAASSGGVDQLRSDLFQVTITPPAILNSNLTWNDNVSFAVSKFPFPGREREVIPIKYLQMTNYQIGGDVPTGAITIPVRYTFNQPTAQVLEEWHWATSNPNGAVALTSTIKTNGLFTWLAPNTAAALQYDYTNSSATANSTTAFNNGGAFVLEGCLVKGLKPSDADMETGTGLVTLEFILQIDRYYPLNTSDLYIQNVS